MVDSSSQSASQLSDGRIRVRARIRVLGIDAGSHVEIDDTPAVRAKIAAGWLVQLKYGSGQGISE